MEQETFAGKQVKGLSVFEKYLTLWVLLCIAGGLFRVKLGSFFRCPEGPFPS